MGSAEKRGHGAQEVQFILRETVRGGIKGRRDGRTEGWRNGDMSVDTSVLIAAFQGSYSTYLLSISYFFFTFKVSNTGEYLV